MTIDLSRAPDGRPGHLSDGSGGGAGPTASNTVDLGVGDPAGDVYTTTGSKTLGGLTFNLIGVDATNTWIVDDVGMRAVGGGGVVFAEILAADFPDIDVTKPFGVRALLDDGTQTSGGAESFLYVAEDSGLLQRYGVVRSASAVQAKPFSGGANTTLGRAVAGATDLSAIGMMCEERSSMASYWIRGDTIGDPRTSGRFAIAAGRDAAAFTGLYAVLIGFSGAGARGKRFTSIVLDQFPERTV